MALNIIDLLYQQMIMANHMANQFPSDITVMYHGTANIWVADISKQGLQPIDAHRWKATMTEYSYNPNRDDDHGYVSLTPKLSVAQSYAKARAMYLRTEPGGTFYWNDRKMVKDLDAPVIKNARPAVLSVTIDEHIRAAISSDPKSPNWRVEGKIPSILIKRVTLPKAAAVTPCALWQGHDFSARGMH